MAEKINKILLIVIDGFGIAENWGGNAVTVARMPFYDSLLRSYQSAKLIAHGKSVGLPGNEIGNSEVGHLTIGAGRVVPQDSLRINKSIDDQSFFSNEALCRVFEEEKSSNRPVHFIGLLSDGVVHASFEHLKALIKLAQLKRAKKVYLHLFTDGRDTTEQGGIELMIELDNYINQLLKEENKLVSSSSSNRPWIEVATISGRYFAMDRDHHYERTKLTVDCMTLGKGARSDNPVKAISQRYSEGKTDQYIQPTVILDNNSEPRGLIKDGDPIIFFNFRSDRARQLSEVLMKINPSSTFITFIPYGLSNDFDGGKDPIAAFQPEPVNDCLAEVLSKNNLNQIHIAETEKYAHVTYFFNTGAEEPFPGEDRILVPSPRIHTYDTMPQMSLDSLVSTTINKIQNSKYSFILLNIANADMVGHTGNFNATLKALMFIDIALNKIISKAHKKWITVITSDHGNVEQMVNPLDSSQDPEHTRNPVPFIIVPKEGKESYNIKARGSLADVAPTLLKLLEIEIPDAMTGQSLII